eukprot:TRINITY_DN1616_c0_g2_i2.p1 TRINITY_DN1616_c0_g2~~TRINITY_DN1616_c0_g2_i2.p1  ORF type:complete len:309 (-),score=65.42 TRINITY_DN1616_c0_g2_i2:116-1042(-)
MFTQNSTPDFSFLDDPDFGTPDFFGSRLPYFPLAAMSTPSSAVESDISREFSSTCELPERGGPMALPNQPESSEKSKLAKYAKGTTTLAFKFKEGIIVAVDARASMGSFISSNKVRKVIEINEYLLGTMAGGAADCFFWERQITKECRLYELMYNEKLTVRAASKLLWRFVTSYEGLSMGTMVAGSDVGTGETDLYFVDDAGMRIQGDLFSVGSGSPYAYGVLDTGYRYDLSLDEAVDLGIKAIINATYKDSGSGGVVRVYHVHKAGWKKIHDALDVSKICHELYDHKECRGLTCIDRDSIACAFCLC